MSFEVRICCDADGCDAHTTIAGERGGFGGIPAIADPAVGFVLDTEWISWPDGWRSTDEGELCPLHAGRWAR